MRRRKCPTAASPPIPGVSPGHVHAGSRQGAVMVPAGGERRRTQPREDDMLLAEGGSGDEDEDDARAQEDDDLKGKWE